MEKLAPILKHKYWICFGLALIFVLVGWWSASGDLATKTDLRKKSVEDSFSSAGQGKTDPNELWVAGGKKENESDSAAYKTASLQLWKRQQAAREWPEQMRSEMQKIKYFADFTSNETRERWVSIYQKQIEDLLKIVQPFQHDTGEGLVLVDANRITRQPFNKWQIDLPSSNEIWSNQEDIWLLKALLTSISKTNGNAARITDSQVLEIRQLTLRGGDRKTKPGAKAGGGMGGGMVGGMGGGGMGGGGMGGGALGMSGGGMTGSEIGMTGGGGGGGIAGLSHLGTAFEGKSGSDILVEEFGAVAGGGGNFGAAVGEDYAATLSSGQGMGNQPGGSKTTGAKKEVRYVDDAEKDQGYKTRGFLLDVVIRDERLPDLLAKLTNSDFPVEIVRVEILSHVSGSGASSSGGYGGGGMPGGYGGGTPGGFGGGSGGGMGMPGPEMPGGAGGAGGYPGNSGAMSPNMGGAEFGGLSDEDGFSGAGGESGLMGTGAGTEAAKGTEVLNAAMADPLLIEVHIGGLLTLYMTPEESETQSKTEEISAKEAEKSPPTVVEPITTDAAGTPSATNPGAESSATDAKQDTSVPGAATSGTAEPGAVAEPSAGSVGPPTDGSVSEPPVAPQLNNPPAVGDGSPIVPSGESVPDGKSPPGGSAP